MKPTYHETDSNQRCSTNIADHSYNSNLSHQNRETNMNQGLLTPKRPIRESTFTSPKTVASVKIRNRARDDLALCSATQTSKVKRHASVMLYRYL